MIIETKNIGDLVTVEVDGELRDGNILNVHIEYDVQVTYQTEDSNRTIVRKLVRGESQIKED